MDPFGTPLNGRTAAPGASASPWDDNFGGAESAKPIDRYAAFASPALDSIDKNKDPFGADNFISGSKVDGPSKDAFAEFSGTPAFGDNSDSDFGGGATRSEDPFGTVDPFKDAFGKQEDKFSWDDEPDPFATTGGDSGIDSSVNNNSSGDNPFAVAKLNDGDLNSAVGDPFNFSVSLNKNVVGGVEVNSSCVNNSNLSGSNVRNVVDKIITGGEFSSNSSKINVNENITSDTDSINDRAAVKDSNVTPSSSDSFKAKLNSTLSKEPSVVSGRSKSVLADPIANVLSLQSTLPTRSKTAMGDPIPSMDSFDPLASSGNSPKKSAWLSNEDLINETFGSKNDIFNNNNTNNSFDTAFGVSSSQVSVKPTFDDFANFPSSNQNYNDFFADSSSPFGMPSKASSDFDVGGPFGSSGPFGDAAPAGTADQMAWGAKNGGCGSSVTDKQDLHAAFSSSDNSQRNNLFS